MEFQSLKLIAPILRALEKERYVVPTPIQEKAIPLLLDNKDMIGIAQTGTGKTAAFVLPIIQKLHEKVGNVRAKNPKALILAPTRELAAQIYESFETYGSFLDLEICAVYGGVRIMPQIRELQRGIDILIATPGRLLDLMNQRRVNLNEIEFFVLDEADRMLDMGFSRDINQIASKLPKQKQSLFFSATMPKEIAELTRKYLKNPVRVEVTPQATPVEKIEQRVFFIDSENKIKLLLDLIDQKRMSCILVFVKTKHKADKVARMLCKKRISADAIHGNKSQQQRMRTLKDFKSGKIHALVATDIAARGIDVENISHVINYDLPNEPENYVHRIGRTARAGTDGTAYSFCSAEEKNYLNEIEKITKKETPHAEHKYHSEKAKDAIGADAKPKSRQRGQRPRYGRSNGFNRKPNGNRTNNSFRSNKNNRYNQGDRDGGNNRYGGDSRDDRGNRGNRSNGGRNNGNSRFGQGRSNSNRPRRTFRR